MMSQAAAPTFPIDSGGTWSTRTRPSCRATSPTRPPTTWHICCVDGGSRRSSWPARCANLCLEDHMRNLIRDGFETVMVRDAVAAAANEEGSGLDAAMINWRFMANAGVDHGRDGSPDGRGSQGSRLKSTRVRVRAVATKRTTIERRRTIEASVASVARPVGITGKQAQRSYSPDHRRYQMSKGTILVIGSNATELEAQGGGTIKIGQFLNETAVPLMTLGAAGYDFVLATPTGEKPHVDQDSDALIYFANDDEARSRARDFFNNHPSMNDVRTIRSVIDGGLDRFVGVFFPGGRAPVVDVMQNADAGEVLRYFHDQEQTDRRHLAMARWAFWPHWTMHASSAPH